MRETLLHGKVEKGGILYGCLACVCTDDSLVWVIIVYKQSLHISINNYWNINCLGHLGWGLRVSNSQQSLTSTTLDFMYTQDRDDNRTIDGWF